MKAKYFFLALSAIVLGTSCSNDEVTEISDSNAIKFNVVANKPSRVPATTTSSINEFAVWAYTSNKLYMDGVEVTRSDGQTSWSYSNTVFWPSTAVDFFSVSPIPTNDNGITVAKDNNNSTVSITNYSVTDGKTDLLYAFNKSETRTPNTAADVVNVNFRHALSQIAFKVKNTNPSIQVTIKDVKVEGLADKSTLTWATATTGHNMATDTPNDTETGQTWGTWSTPVKTETDAYGREYIFRASTDKELIAGSTAADLGESLFLMPQKLDPWNGKGTKGNGDNKTNYGARLLIQCQIKGGVNKDVQIWPVPESDNITPSDYGYVAIPLTNPNNDTHRGNTEDSQAKHDKWMQGKKYVYTIVFGEGGGYIPDPDPDPKPVLVPITFKVTVDVFQDGGSYDVNMKDDDLES